MAFVDELKLHIKAGHGGHGVERWRHEKGKEFGGPSGGNGGRGGDVFARAVRDIGILASYRNAPAFVAGRGEDGMKHSMYGKAGEPLTIDFPIGSILKNLTTGERFELLKEGETIQILKGGKGGYGNEHFKSSTNVRPKEFTLGEPGEEADFFVELLLLVDAGLIGFPNAGKSSLLNAITNAQAKVGNYMFTTLEPNLGALYGFVLADIPGLIEGAAHGKGLGHKFLRHITRTKMLIHLISLENEDVVAAYQTIRDELKAYDASLLTKPEIVVLTKTDMVSPEVAKERCMLLKKKHEHVFALSVYDDPSLKEFTDALVKLLRSRS